MAEHLSEYECWKCGALEHGTKTPLGWTAVPDNVSVYLCWVCTLASGPLNLMLDEGKIPPVGPVDEMYK